MLADRLASAVDELWPDRRVLVAIDGPDAAGKTMLADALAERINRPTLRASIDDWHNPREVRLRQGDESPAGYYEDSFAYGAVTAQLLQPFRAGARHVRTAGFDLRSDARALMDVEVGASTTALLFDGVFLLRRELRRFWDLSIYLHVPEAVTLARAVQRDAELLGGEQGARRRYESRYLPGQALYREAASPLEKANFVIDNSDPADPRILRWSDVE